MKSFFSRASTTLEDGRFAAQPRISPLAIGWGSAIKCEQCSSIILVSNHRPAGPRLLVHQPQASSVVIESRPARERLLSAGNSPDKEHRKHRSHGRGLAGLPCWRLGGWHLAQIAWGSFCLVSALSSPILSCCWGSSDRRCRICVSAATISQACSTSTPAHRGPGTPRLLCVSA